MLKIIQQYEYTHMPFIFYQENEPKMLFTVIQKDYWKLYYSDGKKSYKIKTNIDQQFKSTQYHMCQPTCYKKNDIYHISFCVQFDKIIRLYYGETKDLTEFLNVREINRECFGGCVSPNYIMITLNNNLLFILKHDEEIPYLTKENLQQSKNLLYQFNNLRKFTARVSYVFNNDDNIIISYADPQIINNYGSVYFNLKDFEHCKLLLTPDKKPIYKASIDPFTNDIYYGQKINYGFEQRKIRKMNLNEIKYIEDHSIQKVDISERIYFNNINNIK